MKSDAKYGKSRELAAFLALKYTNMGFPMYVTLKKIPMYNLSPVKGLIYLHILTKLNTFQYK